VTTSTVVDAGECPSCNGYGSKSKTCDMCGGSGRIRVN
jgi:DnaJ-class molecular chaperone